MGKVIPVVKKVITDIENPDYQAQAWFWATHDSIERSVIVEAAHAEALEMNAEFDEARYPAEHAQEQFYEIAPEVRGEVIDDCHAEALEMNEGIEVAASVIQCMGCGWDVEGVLAGIRGSMYRAGLHEIEWCANTALRLAVNKTHAEALEMMDGTKS